MDKCHYCGIEYHPMPRWTSNSKLVYVCHVTITNCIDGDFSIESGSRCEEKAVADGFVKRLDLTPKR